MGISAIYLLDLRGKPLIFRNYRDDVPFYMIDSIVSNIQEQDEEGLTLPLLQVNGVTFCYIKHNGVYMIASTTQNTNCAMIFTFLHKILRIMIESFKEVTEESIRDNFVFIYELLDEVMDFGYPQFTDASVLQEYILQDRCRVNQEIPRVPAAVTNAVSWRSEGITYKRNEVFIDVVESLNVLIDSEGHLVQSEIVGSINMRVFLSGMAELRLGLNDRVIFEQLGKDQSKAVALEDVKFHQCVRLGRFETDRTISFIPPDGEFELMSYRIDSTQKPIIGVHCNHRYSRVEYHIRVKSNFKKRAAASRVELFIPTPSDAHSPEITVGIGHAGFRPETGGIIWTIRDFPGGKEFYLSADLKLSSIASENEESRPPIRVKFEVPYFTMSGLQVRYLKIIEKSGYGALPWVRYVTRSGDYLVRVKNR